MSTTMPDNFAPTNNAINYESIEMKELTASNHAAPWPTGHKNLNKFAHMNTLINYLQNLIRIKPTKEIEEYIPQSPFLKPANRTSIIHEECASNLASQHERPRSLDKKGNLFKIRIIHLENSSDTSRANYYGAMYTRNLIREAEKGNADFELFMELHRRAVRKFLLHGTRYAWDQGVEGWYGQNRNAILAREYDVKWGIGTKGGCTWKVVGGKN